MEREILIAPEGKYYTNGETYGKEIHLAEGLDGSDWYLMEELEVQLFEDAAGEDYIYALGRFGV
jgi:hypothetical protein